MARRIISAAVAVPLGIIVLVLDYIPLYITVFAAISAVATYEILLATKYLKNKSITAVSLSFVLILPYMICIPAFKNHIVLVCSAFVLALFVIMLFMHEKVSFEEVALVGLVSVCIPISLSTLVLMRIKLGEHGLFCIVFTLIAAWIGDAGAYFIGTFFGKHKMAPKISPKKSWEGFFGGIVTAGIAGFLCGAGYELIEIVFYGNHTFETDKLFLVGTAVICSVLGVVGDLSASIIKRQCAVKDFGNILPGHGGVLDRFDSVLFVAPFVYQLFLFHSPFHAIG